MDEPWKAVDPEAANRMWEMLRSEEELFATTMLEELERRGWTPAPSLRVTDAELPKALERLVLDLSWINVYLHFTEHLSDRELYEAIMEEIRENPITIFPNDAASAISIGFLWVSEESEQATWLRFYASEEERTKETREGPIPPSEDAPFPRAWIPERPE